MSPFRILRERSQSRERPVAVREGAGKVDPSPVQDERQAEPGVRRSISPNPFQWLCRERHTRRKTY